MPTRNASAAWEGGLQGGKGSFSGESGAIRGSYGFTRFQEGGGGTNPEELLAAAEASCFSMALAAGLEKAGVQPQRVSTDAACTVEKVGEGFQITTIRLKCRVSAPGLDDAQLQEIAQKTKVGCPVSKALAGVQIELDASLE